MTGSGRDPRALRHQRVLITGCGGMLGHYTYPLFRERYPTVLATDRELTEPWLEDLDVRDDARVSHVFKDLRPDLVLHLAAETDCEFCEADPRASWETNTRATRDLALLSKEHGAALVFISTAAIFPGTVTRPYTEDDVPSPTMAYGHHKLEAEHHVRFNIDEHFIFRAGWMMGAGPTKDKKYTAKILRQILEGRSTIYAVTDKNGIPGYTLDFARNMLALVETSHYGTYHMVCGGPMATRFDVAQEILAVCGREDIELVPTDSEMFAAEYFSPRPDCEAMVNANLNKIGMNLQRPWREVLREYIPTEWPHAIARADAAAKTSR